MGCLWTAVSVGGAVLFLAFVYYAIKRMRKNS